MAAGFFPRTDQADRVLHAPFHVLVTIAPRPRKSPRKSVASILRAAYRRFAGDPVTRRAVKLCLPVLR